MKGKVSMIDNENLEGKFKHNNSIETRVYLEEAACLSWTRNSLRESLGSNGSTFEEKNRGINA